MKHLCFMHTMPREGGVVYRVGNKLPTCGMSAKKKGNEMNLLEKETPKTMFPTQLRELIAVKHISVESVATYLEVPTHEVLQYLSGTKEPTALTVIRLATLFDVSCDYLLRGTFIENNGKVERLSAGEKLLLDTYRHGLKVNKDRALFLFQVVKAANIDS